MTARSTPASSIMDMALSMVKGSGNWGLRPGTHFPPSDSAFHSWVWAPPLAARRRDHGYGPLDGEGLRQLGLEAGPPFPVLRLRLPQMDLRIHDHAPVNLRGRLVRALRCQHRTGADGTGEETASWQRG